MFDNNINIRINMHEFCKHTLLIKSLGLHMFFTRHTSCAHTRV